MQDSIVSGLQSLHKLTHLRIVIGASVYIHKIAPSQFAPTEEYAHSFRRSTFDWEGSAATLSGALPSLQNIFLTTGGFLANWEEPTMEDADEGGGRWKPYERWYITHGWRVVDSGSGMGGTPEASLVELHEDVAETIIRNEELVLSEFDEVNCVLFGVGERKLSAIFRHTGNAPLELWLGPYPSTFVRAVVGPRDGGKGSIRGFLSCYIPLQDRIS